MAGNKPWEQRPTGRRAAQTMERRRVLIVCEDSKSSCYYFRSFKQVVHERAELLALGTGMNTDSLIEHAMECRKKAAQAGVPYNDIWCVFDRDSFPPRNYQRAFELAYSNGIKVAWANEAFELWYLLHFNYHDTGMSRDQYKSKLKPNLNYDKSDEEIYTKVKPYQETALKNASRLERHWHEMGSKFPERENPSISVHKIVAFLNELAELGKPE